MFCGLPGREAYDAIAAASDQANRAPPPPAPPGPGPGPQRKRDPAIVNRARAAGVRLERFEDVGLEEQAVAELTRMVESSRQEGFLAYVKQVSRECDGRCVGGGLISPECSLPLSLSPSHPFTLFPVPTYCICPIVVHQVANASSSAEASIDANGAAGAVAVPGGAAGVEAVFAQGTEISQQTWQDMLARQVCGLSFPLVEVYPASFLAYPAFSPRPLLALFLPFYIASPPSVPPYCPALPRTVMSPPGGLRGGARGPVRAPHQAAHQPQGGRIGRRHRHLRRCHPYLGPYLGPYLALSRPLSRPLSTPLSRAASTSSKVPPTRPTPGAAMKACLQLASIECRRHLIC